MPATSVKVTRFCWSGVTRRAFERPKLPRAPPPDIERRMSQMNSPTSRIVGPKPSRIVPSSERPSSGGEALVTTFLESSSSVSPRVSTNAGTCVSKRSTCTVSLFSPTGVNGAVRFRRPWIVWSSDEISCTLPARTWSRKKGS
jgi:hypothetical protein